MPVRLPPPVYKSEECIITTIRQIVYECCKYALGRLLHPSIRQFCHTNSGHKNGGKALNGNTAKEAGEHVGADKKN